MKREAYAHVIVLASATLSNLTAALATVILNCAVFPAVELILISNLFSTCTKIQS